MMTQSQLEAIAAFAGVRLNEVAVAAQNVQFKPLAGGLINQSFRFQNQEGKDLLVQKINTEVFLEPAAVQANYLAIWQYIRQLGQPVVLPEPVWTVSGEPLFRDSAGAYWRAFQFIAQGVMHPVASSAQEAFATAQTFGRFTAAMHAFDVSRLHVVIPRFHHLGYRYAQFQNSLEKGDKARIRDNATLIQAMVDRSPYCHFYTYMLEHPALFPLRAMHHDAKIANVLFQEDTGEVICAVDFDTVMPGLYFSDLGDMIRSMACNVDENEPDSNRILLQPKVYDAIVSGYCAVMDPFLTATEKKHIHHAGLLMIYMQALRFLTDHLEKDHYYRITYPMQNRDRAMNQWVLLQQLEAYLHTGLHYDAAAAPSK